MTWDTVPTPYSFCFAHAKNGKIDVYFFLIPDNLLRRVYGGGGPCLAHEALCLPRVRPAGDVFIYICLFGNLLHILLFISVGRSALHHAGGKALLPLLLRLHVRRVLRRLRGGHRGGPG